MSAARRAVHNATNLRRHTRRSCHTIACADALDREVAAGDGEALVTPHRRRTTLQGVWDDEANQAAERLTEERRLTAGREERAAKKAKKARLCGPCSKRRCGRRHWKPLCKVVRKCTVCSQSGPLKPPFLSRSMSLPYSFCITVHENTLRDRLAQHRSMSRTCPSLQTVAGLRGTRRRCSRGRGRGLGDAPARGPVSGLLDLSNLYCLRLPSLGPPCCESDMYCPLTNPEHVK